MKLIAEGAFSVVADDIIDSVYYIIRDKRNHHERFFKTDLYSITEVSQEEYVGVKFGNSWKTIHSVYTECIRITNGEYLTCHFESSVIIRHNQDGKKVHTYNIASLKTGFDTIYSITLDINNHLWLTQPSSHFIGQYDLNSEQQIFKIGGDHNNPDMFNYPEQIKAYGDYVYISDMGNQRIWKLQIDTKELTEHLRFEEPTWEYVQFKGRELVRLQSGLYII